MAEHISPELRPDCRATPLSALLGDTVTAGAHFTRSHFGVPVIAQPFVFEVTGLVRRPIRWTMPDLRKLSHRSTHVTLECAGHRRAELDPMPAGVPWDVGAVGHARWAGGQLVDLLDVVKPLPEATHLVFVGADHGAVEGRDAPEPFARAVPLRDPVVREILLAWEMNGRALEPEHGAPVRAIVPGWYAVASVKWLQRIEFTAAPFDGFFQAVDYRLARPGDDGPGEELTALPVNALIVPPPAPVPAGDVAIEGVAWGGTRGVAGVDVQVDDGEWTAARIDPGPGVHAPTRFSLTVALDPGTHAVRARARDREGDAQPLETEWNARGYGIRSARVETITVT